jgi:hypothetical protein
MGKLKPLKRPKVFIPLTIVMLVIAAFVSAIIHLNSPAEGTIINSPQNDNLNAFQPNTATRNYSDDTLSFHYPGKFETNPRKADSGYIDIVNLLTTQRHDEYASIGVYKGSFQNDSGIRFRTDRPSQYKVVISSTDKMVFAKTDQLEYTGFLQKQDKIVSISFTSVGPQDMAGDFNAVADSLQLKE